MPRLRLQTREPALPFPLTTNSSGNYTAKELPIGTYKLTAEAAGFKTMSDNNVVLNAGVIAHVDFKLTFGKATEVVEVTGAAVAVQTDDAKLYSTVSSHVIANTVLAGRDVFDLMQIDRRRCQRDRHRLRKRPRHRGQWRA